MRNSSFVLIIVITVLMLGGVFSGTSSNSPYYYVFVSASDDSANSDSLDQSEDSNSETMDEADNDGDVGDVDSSEVSNTVRSDDNQSNAELQTLSSIKKKNNDNVPPAIVSVKPTSGTANIPTTSKVEASFNEPMQKSTLSPSTFKVTSSNMVQTQGLISVSADGKTAIFTPNSLSPSTQYKATITKGVKDLAGNSMASDQIWSFTTASASTVPDNTGFENLGDTLGLADKSQASPATTAGDSPSNDSLEIEGAVTAPKGEPLIKFLNDAELVDRILPLIVEKIDVNTLISKADGRKLLEKVLPFVDVKISASQQAGPKSTIDVTGIAKNLHRQAANCNLGETLVGGGYDLGSSGLGANTPTRSWRNGGEWSVLGDFSVDGSIQAYAECLSVEVGIKP